MHRLRWHRITWGGVWEGHKRNVVIYEWPLRHSNHGYLAVSIKPFPTKASTIAPWSKIALRSKGLSYKKRSLFYHLPIHKLRHLNGKGRAVQKMMPDDTGLEKGWRNLRIAPYVLKIACCDSKTKLWIVFVVLWQKDTIEKKSSVVRISKYF